MRYRKKLIQATTVLLYMGPLLAGLAGYGPAYLLPFVLLFMLWLVMLRPHKWPQNFMEWRQTDALLAALTLAVTQILFVALLFGVGRGIGGVLGYLPLFHPMLPVSMSFLALPLLRLAWVPEAALAGDETIDQLLWSAGTATAAPRPVPALAEAALSELFAVSEDRNAGAELLLDRLDHFLDTGDNWSRLALLSAVLDASPEGEHVALRIAVILKATDPLPQPEHIIPGEIRAAFVAAGKSPELLGLLAQRGQAVLQKTPGAAHSFPPRELVQELAAACQDSSTAQSLLDLAAGLLRTTDEEPAQARPVVAKPPARKFVPPAATAQGA